MTVPTLQRIASKEASPVPRTGAGAGDRGRRLVALGAALLVAWSLWGIGVGRKSIVNPGGWEVMRRFWAAALHPELDGDFLRLTWDATTTTVAFAVLGTALAVVVGVVGGVLTSATWWRGDGRRRPRPGWHAVRAGAALPRGVHEAMWALFLVNVLGRDPLVGVLAIAIPFGAITAKVYADIIDDHADAGYDSLRLAGAGRVVGLAYGVLPRALPELVSYAFYRLECSLRSAVILGIIGAGGLGFQLSLSMQSLRYGEMWTLIYATVLVCAAADQWSALLRRRAAADAAPATGRRVRRASLAAALVLVVWSFAHLDLRLSSLWSDRTRALAGDLAEAAWPPALPSGGWGELLRRAVETLQLSIVAMALATVLALVVAFVAARPREPGAGVARRAAGAVARLVLLVLRAIPPVVWALVVLFVLFPGPVPGAVALGVYNFGVLGRLLAEVVENLDDAPAAALRTGGAGRVTTFLYAVAPLAAPRFASFSLYRWEVAMRETVVVGLVGAGGLGRLLAQQNVAFDFAGMLGTTLAFVALTVVVDIVGATARRALR